MRWFLDAIGLVTVVLLLLGVLAYQRARDRKEALVERAACEVRRFELEIKYRAASRIGDLNTRGWPVTLDPKWFESDPPQNPLLMGDRPWLEIATIDDAALEHPSVRMSIRDNMAAFWYNPYQGIVRARVPVMINDEQSLAMYNRVNSCGLSSIFPKGAGGDSRIATTENPDDGGDDAASRPGERQVEVTATGQVIKKHSK